MCLQEQIRLDMRALQIVLVDWDGHQVRQSLVQNVFVMTDGKSSELLSLGEDVNYLINAGFSLQSLV